MRPGFFLGIFHNVGDGFAYELLTVDNYCDIPTNGLLHTFICSVVQNQELTSIDFPNIHYKNGHWIVTNQNSDPIGEEHSTPAEELHSNIEVSEEEDLYLNKQKLTPGQVLFSPN